MFGKQFGIGAMFCVLLVAPVRADQIELTGTLRDFKRGDWSGGHFDFQTAGLMGRFGHVKGMVTMELGADGKPVYNPTRPSKDTMQSAASFNQWYNDVPNVNASSALTLTLNNNQEGLGGVYTYQNNAFWPIDNQFFGNQNLNHNYHFTFELHTTFTYRPGHYFTFIGDDDVWVYINGKRVIDLGGVHEAVTGSVLLLDGKAFVQKSQFSAGGMVQTVSASMAAAMATNWSRLHLSGACPIVEGDLYIDLAILAAGAPEARSVFNGAQVTVYATKALETVVIQFVDGTTQQFSNLSGYEGSFAGTGAYEGKGVAGCWVKASGDSSTAGLFNAANGGEEHDTTLDFFFAERHTTQSNFRIDTSMRLRSASPATVSALYD